MRYTSHFTILSLLSFSLLAGCGGGSGNTNASTNTGTNASAALAGASTIGSTTTTSAGATTTTLEGNTTTTWAGATTTTASSTTTTSSSTTTTNNGSLPPLASIKTVLQYQSTLGTPTFSEGNTTNGGKGQSFGNANCVPYDQMSKNYFVKPHISIFKDGQRLAVSRYIGLLSSCIYEIHNHDMSGVFHVFSTAYKRVTLNDLFRIWGQTLSSNAVGDISGQPVVVYVEDNGVLRQQTGDIGDVELTDHVSITIQIGTKLNEIPVYDWSQYPADE